MRMWKNAFTTRRRGLSLFQKLFLSTSVFILLPLLFSYYYVSNQTKDYVSRQFQTERLNSLEQSARSMEELMRSMMSLSMILSQSDPIKQLLNKEEVSEPAYTKLDKLNQVSKLLDSSALLISTSRTYVTLVSDHGFRYTNWPVDNPYAEQYLNANRDSISLFPRGFLWRGVERNFSFDEQKTRPYVLTLATYIPEQGDTKPSAVLLISVMEDDIRSLITGVSSSKRVLNGKGIVVSSPDSSEIGTTYSRLRAINPDSKASELTPQLTDNKDVIIYERNLKYEQWKIIDEEPRNEVVGMLQKERNRLLGFIVLFVAVFLLASAGITRSITNPIRVLARRMMSLAPDVRTKVQIGSGSGRRDEVGMLNESFQQMKNNIAQLIDDNTRKEKRKREAELEALQAQISPHFLFNTLNTVRWTALNGNMRKVSDMVLALTKLLRMTLLKENEFITVSEELDNVQNYVLIMKMRQDLAFDVQVEVDEELQKTVVPKLLLQPLVENCIIHGFSQMKAGGVITIRGHTDQENPGQWRLSVKDNGKVLDRGQGEEAGITKAIKVAGRFSGVGLSNVEERIKLCYGPQYGLQFNSVPEQGVEVIVTLPKYSGTE
ncbi:MAG: sensor histidine kinase [Gorillibacterium sp.]|nr:sensor histidine kinase [Gorillibacterium sp.]